MTDAGVAIGRKRVLAGVVLAALAVPVAGQDGAPFPADRVKTGAGIYAANCAPCHGPRMRSPEVPADLRKFPTDEKARFLDTVAKGRGQMPPWGGLLSVGDIEALWAYVVTDRGD